MLPVRTVNNRGDMWLIPIIYKRVDFNWFDQSVIISLQVCLLLSDGARSFIRPRSPTQSADDEPQQADSESRYREEVEQHVV